MNTDLNSPDFNKKLPFTVPNGYFDKLPQRIQEKCTSAPEAVRTHWLATLKSQLAFAAGFAMLALLASLGYYYSQQLTTKQAIPQNSDYVEIVSRSIYNDFEHIKATEVKRHKIDSLNEFTNGMFLRYYSPNKKFSSISEEKRDMNIIP